MTAFEWWMLVLGQRTAREVVAEFRLDATTLADWLDKAELEAWSQGSDGIVPASWVPFKAQAFDELMDAIGELEGETSVYDYATGARFANAYACLELLRASLAAGDTGAVLAYPIGDRWCYVRARDAENYRRMGCDVRTVFVRRSPPRRTS